MCVQEEFPKLRTESNIGCIAAVADLDTWLQKRIHTEAVLSFPLNRSQGKQCEETPRLSHPGQAHLSPHLSSLLCISSHSLTAHLLWATSGDSTCRDRWVHCRMKSFQVSETPELWACPGLHGARDTEKECFFVVFPHTSDTSLSPSVARDTQRTECSYVGLHFPRILNP